MTPPYPAPAIGRAIKCPEDAKRVYERHTGPGAVPPVDYSPQRWAVAMFRTRVETLARHLAELAMTERTDDLLDDWQRAHDEVRALAADLQKATEDR